MNNVIRNLINAYDSPVLFSDAQQGTILFANNEVHQKLGFPENKLTGTSLKELLKYNKIIQAQSIWKHNEDYYLIQNEKLTLEGYNYIKSVLKPFPDDSALPGATFQKEITRHLMHRLRSPLNATLGFNKLLKENGLIGLEKYHSGDTPIGMLLQEMMCNKFNLEWTLGSDFHEDHDDFGNQIGYGKNKNLCRSSCSLIKTLRRNGKVLKR